MSSLLFLALFVLRNAAALAMDTNSTSPLTFNPSSPTLAASINIASPLQRCENIDNCRTLSGIVQSCIATILACVWFAVHRNIPEPKTDRDYKMNSVIWNAQWVYSIVLNQRQSFIVFIVALIIPEWILAWAVRQWLMARKLAKRLEAAEKQALNSVKGKDPQMDVSRNGVGKPAGGAQDQTGTPVLPPLDSCNERFVFDRSSFSTGYIGEQCGARGCTCDAIVPAEQMETRKQGMPLLQHEIFLNSDAGVEQRMGNITRIFDSNGRISFL